MKSYKKPVLNVETFIPNEYVASCGPAGSKYLFTCDAGGGKSGSVYLETNGKEGLQTGRGGDRYLSGYHACGTTHEASTTDEFLDGYYVTSEYVGNWPWGDYQTVTTPVIVWRGPKHNNTHCTTELDMDKWDKTPS